MDVDSKTMPAGTEIEYVGGKFGGNLRLIKDGHPFFNVCAKALQNKDFFEEIEEKAHVVLEIRYPKGECWNNIRSGEIDISQEIELARDIDAAFKKYTKGRIGIPKPPEFPKDSISKGGW